MKLKEIELGIIDYVENEIASKTNELTTQFMIYGATFYIGFKLEKIANKFSHILKTIDAIDENGNYDIETMYMAAKKAIQKTGQIMYNGIIYNETDIDKLYNYIKKYGGQL